MNYYELLSIARNASGADIDAAYRKKARLHHPDMHQDEQEKLKQAEIFKQVNLAYQTLSDPSKRQRYDLLSPHAASTAPPRPAPPKPKTKEEFERERQEKDRRKNMKEVRTPDAEFFKHIECSFFGGETTGRNIMVQLKLTPSEMKHGCTKMVPIKKRDVCQRCAGDGRGMKMCPRCHGTKPDLGWCQICEGQGATECECVHCDGQGVKNWMYDEVYVKISPGIQPGHSVQVLGAGEEAPRKAPGYVRVVVV